MTRKRQRSEPLGPFSEWHRETMPDWYKNIDIDYVGYIDPYRWPKRGYELYVFVELIHITDESKWGTQTPSAFPIHEHKKRVYQQLEELTGVPTFIVYHPTSCEEFIVQRVGGGELTNNHFNSWSGLANFFDHLRKRKIKKSEDNSSAAQADS